MDDFSAVNNAAVGAATLAVTIPAGAKFMTVYSSVAAYVHKNEATAATAGFYIDADSYVGWIPCGVLSNSSGNQTFTITAVTGNLAIVSVLFTK